VTRLRRLVVRITPVLHDRIEKYADKKNVIPERATTMLLCAGLRAHERAVAAGKARGATFTPDQGRAAVQKRWLA
jgi:hypothetical protein